MWRYQVDGVYLLGQLVQTGRSVSFLPARREHNLKQRQRAGFSTRSKSLRFVSHQINHSTLVVFIIHVQINPPSNKPNCTTIARCSYGDEKLSLNSGI